MDGPLVHLSRTDGPPGSLWPRMDGQSFGWMTFPPDGWTILWMDGLSTGWMDFPLDGWTPIGDFRQNAVSNELDCAYTLRACPDPYVYMYMYISLNSEP